MTHEEMAAELRKAGWRVKEPLTPKNCRHPGMLGSGGINTDGSGYSKSRCPDCGYTSEHNWGVSADYDPLTTLPQNSA